MPLFNFDIILFICTTFVYTRLKEVIPNMLYPLQGINFFLPPQQEDVAALRKQKEGQNKNFNKYQKKKYISNKQLKAELPLKMMKGDATALKKHKYAGEFDMVIMLFTILMGYLVLVNVLRYFIPNLPKYEYFHSDSNISVYLTLFIFFYSVWKLVIANCQTLKSYDTKVSIFVAILVFIMNLVFYFGFQDFFDLTIKQNLQKFLQQISQIMLQQNEDLSEQNEKSNNNTVFKFQQNGISYELCLVLICCFNALISFACIPSIIRLGGCYIATLKQIQLDSQEEEDEQFIQNPTEAQQKQIHARKRDNKQNKQMLNYFKLQFMVTLLIIFSWVKPIINPIQEHITGGYDSIVQVRYILIGINLLLHWQTFKFEIEQFMFKAYSSLQTLFSDFSELNFRSVQISVSSRYHSVVFISFQVFCKIVIPALILAIIIQKGPLFSQNSKTNTLNFQVQVDHPLVQGQKIYFLNYEYNCPVIDDAQLIFWENNNCFKNQLLNFENSITTFGASFNVINRNVLKSQDNISAADLKNLSLIDDSSEENSSKQQSKNDNDTSDIKESVDQVKALVKKLYTFNVLPNEMYESIFGFILFNYYLFNFLITLLYIMFIGKAYEA